MQECLFYKAIRYAPSSKKLTWPPYFYIKEKWKYQKDIEKRGVQIMFNRREDLSLQQLWETEKGQNKGT